MGHYFLDILYVFAKRRFFFGGGGSIKLERRVALLYIIYVLFNFLAVQLCETMKL